MVNFHELLWFMGMLHELYVYLLPYEEIRQLGWNPSTIIFVVTLGLTTFNGHALAKQAHKISLNKSGKSVSFIFFSFLCSSATVVFLYGYYGSKLALVINGICVASFSLIIILNLLRYEKFKVWEIIIGFGSLVFIPLEIISPAKDTIFMLSGSFALGMLLKQVYVVWKNKDSGALHPAPAIVSIFSSSFWLTYAILLDIWPMQVFNSISLVTWIIFLFLYQKYPSTQKKSI